MIFIGLTKIILTSHLWKGGRPILKKIVSLKRIKTNFTEIKDLKANSKIKITDATP
jgi:hypothetical protein